MSSLELPTVAARPYEAVLHDVQVLGTEYGIAGFVFGDMHLWARDGTNNSATVLRVIDDIEAIAGNDPLPTWLTIGDTRDSIKSHRCSRADAAVEERQAHYAAKGCLGQVTGNHDHAVLAHPAAVMRRQQARKKKKRGIEVDLSWMETVTLPRCTVLAIANDELYLGPAAAEIGFVLDPQHRRVFEGLPPYADLLIVAFGGKLHLLRHGDKYDWWWHRSPRLRDNAPKWFLNKVAHLGSSAYDGIGWLRRFLEQHFASKMADDAENKVKRWFNEQLRGVCTNIPEALSIEALEHEVLLRRPIVATLAGHTHAPLRGTFGSHEHVNVGHCRSEVGFAVWTNDGELQGPFVIADSR